MCYVAFIDYNLLTVINIIVIDKNIYTWIRVNATRANEDIILPVTAS